MRRFEFRLTGKTPLLMHADDVMSSDLLEQWLKVPENKKTSKAGDDRTPAWKWHTYLYYDDRGTVCLPAACIMAALRGAAGQLSLKGQKSFKSESQSGLLIEEEFCAFLGAKGSISTESIAALKDISFAEQCAAVKELGFSLDVRRATVGKHKHVRVRPRFAQWSVSGSIQVTSEAISSDTLTSIFELAGKGGLGDWRPSTPGKPGPYGAFEAQLFAQKAKKS